MTIDEWRDVLADYANTQDNMVGLPVTDAQKGTICMLFNMFWDLADGELVFAADDEWFRHRTMELLWGHSSLNKVDMAIASTMISELGFKNPVSERWELTDTGTELLYAVMDELEEKYPTQLAMEGV